MLELFIEEHLKMQKEIEILYLKKHNKKNKTRSVDEIRLSLLSELSEFSRAIGATHNKCESKDIVKEELIDIYMFLLEWYRLVTEKGNIVRKKTLVKSDKFECCLLIAYSYFSEDSLSCCISVFNGLCELMKITQEEFEQVFNNKINKNKERFK